MYNIIAMDDSASITGVNISMYSRKELENILEYQHLIIKFQEYCDGFYYYDTTNRSKPKIKYYYF